jgi:hypothetical protein
MWLLENIWYCMLLNICYLADIKLNIYWVVGSLSDIYWVFDNLRMHVECDFKYCQDGVADDFHVACSVIW